MEAKLRPLSHAFLALLASATGVWLWYLVILLNEPDGGMFSGVRAAIAFAAVATLLAWPVVLAIAVPLFVLLMLFGHIRRHRKLERSQGNNDSAS
jgi:hypothetical protein